MEDTVLRITAYSNASQLEATHAMNTCTRFAERGKLSVTLKSVTEKVSKYFWDVPNWG